MACSGNTSAFEWIVYSDCVITKTVGDLPPGTRVDEITFNIFSDMELRFDHGGRTFFLDAVPVGLTVVD